MMDNVIAVPYTANVVGLKCMYGASVTPNT